MVKQLNCRVQMFCSFMIYGILLFDIDWHVFCMCFLLMRGIRKTDDVTDNRSLN